MKSPSGAGRALLRGAALVAWLVCSSAPSVADGPRSPQQTVDAFHAALRDQDAALTLSLLTKDVVVFEMGFVDQGRDAYAATHLRADIEAAERYERDLVYRNLSGTRDELLVVSAYELRTRDDTASARRRLVESMVLRRVAGQWRIAHIHWSSRNLFDG